MARTVVTQPFTAAVWVVEVLAVLLFLLLLLVQGDFVDLKTVQAVTVVQSLGRGLAEKLMGGSVMRGGVSVIEMKLVFFWSLRRRLLLVPAS